MKDLIKDELIYDDRIYYIDKFKSMLKTIPYGGNIVLESYNDGIEECISIIEQDLIKK